MKQDVSSVPNGFVAAQRYTAVSDVWHELISNVHTPCTSVVKQCESDEAISVRSLNQCTWKAKQKRYFLGKCQGVFLYFGHWFTSHTAD